MVLEQFEFHVHAEFLVFGAGIEGSGKNTAQTR